MDERVWHDSIPIMEWLLHHDPDLRLPFMALGGIDVESGRSLSGVDHPELNGLLSDFADTTQLRILAAVGNVIQIAILRVPDVTRRRTHPVIYINGPTSSVEKNGYGKICSELYSTIEMREFLPPPVCKKIVFIESWKRGRLNGACFTEVGKLLWTVGDPFALPVRQTARSSAKEIIQEILEDIKEGGQA